jgi:hypothetical protein
LPAKVGTTSAAKKLTIKNTGLGVLHGNVNPATGPFVITSGGSGFTLDSKQSRAVTIQFMPTAKGPAIGGAVPITSDDPNHLSLSVNLKGIGK